MLRVATNLLDFAHFDLLPCLAHFEDMKGLRAMNHESANIPSLFPVSLIRSAQNKLASMISQCYPLQCL
jgi:hypothetical protein